MFLKVQKIQAMTNARRDTAQSGARIVGSLRNLTVASDTGDKGERKNVICMPLLFEFARRGAPNG
jgi:hypothetical protein